MPEISPLMQYTNLFSGFMPGTTGTGGAGGGGQAGSGGAAARHQPVADAMLKKLVGRRSVLDFSVEELNQLKRLAPSEARNKLSIHTDAVLAAESAVTNAINTGYPNPRGGGGGGGTGREAAARARAATRPVAAPAATQPAAPPNVVGHGRSHERRRERLRQPDRRMQDDAPVHAQAGALHLDVLKAAFVCDLIRVGTYQWSPGTNHVGFALYPGHDPAVPAPPDQPQDRHGRHHRVRDARGVEPRPRSSSSTCTAGTSRATPRTSPIWKNTVDGCGNSLLDFTCVPFLTEVQACGARAQQHAGDDHRRQAAGLPSRPLCDRRTSRSTSCGEPSPRRSATRRRPRPFAAPLAGFWAKPPA